MAATVEHKRTTAVGLICAVAGAFAFGTLAIFAKYAYADGATPVPLLAVRFAIATALLAAFHLATKRTLGIGRPAIVRLLLLGALGYGFESALFFAALERAPAGVVGLVFYSYPLWTLLLSLGFGLERFDLRLVTALAAGSLGVSLIFSLPSTSIAGPLLALGAAVAVAFYLLLAQIVGRGVPAPAAATYTAAGAAVSLAIATALSGSGLPAAALPEAGALGLATAAAFVAMYAAIARIGSARTAVANMLEPVTTLVLAAVFLGESIGLRVVIGAALILSALPVLATTKQAAPLVSEP